jgi:hypothetical protein
MGPRDQETLKSTLVMQHHSITCDHSMFDIVLFDPGSKQGLGLRIVS